MARGRKKKADDGGRTLLDFRHEDKRTNIPPAKMAAEGRIPRTQRVKYAYSPHLRPALRIDSAGGADRVQDLLAKATRSPLTEDERKLLEEAFSHHQPWLEWAGKAEEYARRFFQVDSVALHIHERISAQAIVALAKRQDVRRDLFADPQQPYSEAVQFYRHDVDWANRLILGDSLQVMSSLAHREGLAGKVQMIYIDPPYGIRFASNFQAEIGRRDVKDRDADLTRQPEMVKAYRDTWTLGVHSYLTYLRDRFECARKLLTDTGSVFVQISDENLHLVRCVLDEVFGATNFVSLISFQTTSGFAETKGLSRMGDYLLWYGRDRSQTKSKALYEKQDVQPGSLAAGWLLTADGEYRGVSSAEAAGQVLLPSGIRFYMPDNLQSQGAASGPQPFVFEGKEYQPGLNNHWKPNFPLGLQRLAGAGRIHVAANSIRYRRMADDFPVKARGNLWTDTLTGSFTEAKMYVVQTNPVVVARCMSMTTDPGDLVLDPTCGSGTTPFVAEQYGRRWIAIDTSRVAFALTRQRILTARYEHYRTRSEQTTGSAQNPGSGFVCASIPHITLKSIANNAALDPILEKHEQTLTTLSNAANAALSQVSDTLRMKLAGKLVDKQRREGKRAVTEADVRRWTLPKRGEQWEHWQLPFDTDPDWPQDLQDAVSSYRQARRAKMEEVEACIQANAEQEELVDQPETVPGVLRVSGPFTVEGVIPEELTLTDGGVQDLTPNEFDQEDAAGLSTEQKNLHAYLSNMLEHLRRDGVTFLNNQRGVFAQLEALFESGGFDGLHAEGAWDNNEDGLNSVAVVFGPQYGPVTAIQVEEAIRASRRHVHLVVAGFSFAPEAVAIISENAHPKLHIHLAHIRPDLNPAMDGLLKETPTSQLFTVFGLPAIEVSPVDKGRFHVTLEGVDIYDPVANTVRSTGAGKVAAWFLDSNFDGRCFCVSQAFFPDQDAWAKIAKTLGAQADLGAFEALQGTTSLPFERGSHGQIAVKVIDPRGNEVMAIRRLPS